jgi:dTDP-4-amino-4,6-dideoxygalactose transaminase
MRIFPTNPYFFEDDIKFITEKTREILEGKSFLSQYKYTEEFEKSFANEVGRKFGLATPSGTSAIELMLKAMHLEDGEIIVPTNTNVCTGFPVVRTNNRIILADCCEDLTVDPEDVKKKMTPNTTAVITVHIGGLVSPHTTELSDICADAGIPLLEDAAHAHGSTLDGQKGGSFGNGAAFSFFSTKTITTGEGGMFLTDNEQVAARAKILRDIGKVPNPNWEYWHEEIAYNWKMPEITSLLGITQVKHLEEFVRKRNKLKDIIEEKLRGADGLRVLEIPKRCRSGLYKYIVFLDKNVNKKKVLDILKTKYEIKLGASVYDLPLHMQPAFKKFANGHLPVAEDVCPRHICPSIYYTMTEEDATYQGESIVKAVKEAMQ